MCYLQPLKVKKIKGNRVFLENGVKAYCDQQSVGKVEAGDKVLVFGNLVIRSRLQKPAGISTN